jgi:hypothetical protein
MLFVWNANAQLIEIREEVSNNHSMDPNTGMMRTNTFSKIKFRIEGDSKYRGIGVTGGRLKEYVRRDPEALKEFKKYKRKKIISISSASAAVLSFVIFGANNLSNNNSQHALPPPNSGGGLLEGIESKEFLYITVGFAAASVITALISKLNIFKSIEIYNGNQFKREREDSGSIMLDFDVIGYRNNFEKSSTVGIGVKLTFP